MPAPSLHRTNEPSYTCYVAEPPNTLFRGGINAISTSANENGGICLHLPPDMDEYDDPFTLCVVESYSAACLHRRWLAFDQLNALVNHHCVST